MKRLIEVSLIGTDNEGDVNEADRALHQRIAAEVKRKLEAKGHLPGTKNVTSEAKFEFTFADEDKQVEEGLIVGNYESHEFRGDKIIVNFKKEKGIVVDQFVTAVGPESRRGGEGEGDEQIEAGPIALLGEPKEIKKLLQPIYDLGGAYSHEVFSTVLGIKSEDGLLEVIGAAGFRTGAYVEDTKKALKRLEQLEDEKEKLEQAEGTLENRAHLEDLKGMLKTFKSIGNKFNNAKKAHSKSVIVAEQLGTLNSTIEAINRVNAVMEDETGDLDKLVDEQIRRDGISMQIDSWNSIKRYILMKWVDLKAKADLTEDQKGKEAETAARTIVGSRGKKEQHAHGITWEEAMDIIEKNITH